MNFRAAFNLTSFRRLLWSIREEGLRTALIRAVAFLRRTLPETPQTEEPVYLGQFWQIAAQQNAFHVSQPPALLTKTRRIAMIGDLNLPQCRKYRVAQQAELWDKLGVEYDFSHTLDIPRAFGLLQNATHLMLYRVPSDERLSAYLYEAARLRLPVLYDIDDPLFSVSAYATYENMKAVPAHMKAHFLAQAPLYLSAMNQADILTVSTPGLADHTRAYSNRPVHVRRNFADQETLAAAEAALRGAKDRTEGPFRVGFASGSMGHEVDFGLIAKDIAAFLEAGQDRQLVILGHFEKALLPAALQDRVEMHPFTSYSAYLETLSTLHCTVMPLTDDAFNRCKSGVRVIDAAAVAVPSLVGAVSDMATLVTAGETGLVLGPEDSWQGALETLAQDRAGTVAMGQAARTLLLSQWTARAEPPVIEQDVVAWVQGG